MHDGASRGGTPPEADALPALVPASFLSYSGDVSWEFVVAGRGSVRAGVRLAVRRRLQRLFGADAATGELTALAAAALLTGGTARDASDTVWVTPADLDRLSAVVRARRQEARPVFSGG